MVEKPGGLSSYVMRIYAMAGSESPSIGRIRRAEAHVRKIKRNFQSPLRYQYSYSMDTSL